MFNLKKPDFGHFSGPKKFGRFSAIFKFLILLRKTQRVSHGFASLPLESVHSPALDSFLRMCGICRFAVFL